MDYHRPNSLDEALGLLSQTGGRIAAGCTDLFPATQLPMLAGPVVDITAIPSLRGLEETDFGLRIGATTTWGDIITAELPPAFDMLKEAAREVGSTQVQNAGTLAGNICNASPAADGVPCLLALEAQIEIARLGETRQIPLQDFLTGARQTSLLPGEVVTAINIPSAAIDGVSRFRKLGARRYLVISIAMVAVRVCVVDRKVAQARLAIGSCSAVATRLEALEHALIGRKVDHTLPNAIATEEVASALAPVSDIRAEAGYRSVAAAELLRRALRDLIPSEVVV